jgi:AcrR family transcriptional regulator
MKCKGAYMKNKSEKNMYDKFVDTMLELILEKGGLTGVNLRLVSKKIGCAHTNAYNYFDGFDGLIFAAYDRALDLYGSAVIQDLKATSNGKACFLKFVENIVEFALENPGYYRFIGSDPFNIQGLSSETIGKAIQLKQFFLDLVYAVVHPYLNREESDQCASIIMSYLDGELFNIINKRAFPEDQVNERIIEYTEKLLLLFIGQSGQTADDTTSISPFTCPEFPVYVLQHLSKDL